MLLSIKKLRSEFWENVRVLGDKNSLNPELEKAGIVADLLELGELFAKDALERNESFMTVRWVESSLHSGVYIQTYFFIDLQLASI